MANRAGDAKDPAAQTDSTEEALSRFASNISHELKSPLAVMKIMLENLLYQPDMPREIREEFIRDMDREIDRLTAIVSELMYLGKSEYLGTVREPEEVDISSLTEETVRLLSHIAQKRGQELTAKVVSGLRMIGDRDRLHQVIYNLIDNAVKYTPRGGYIKVKLEESKGMLVWTVEDNGIGISEKDRDYIFDRFYRADNAKDRETKGNGLGLSIVKRIVNLHGGSITVDSGQGQGTVFTVTLPKNGGYKQTVS